MGLVYWYLRICFASSGNTNMWVNEIYLILISKSFRHSLRTKLSQHIGQFKGWNISGEVREETIAVSGVECYFWNRVIAVSGVEYYFRSGILFPEWNIISGIDKANTTKARCQLRNRLSACQNSSDRSQGHLRGSQIHFRRSRNDFQKSRSHFQGSRSHLQSGRSIIAVNRDKTW